MTGFWLNPVLGLPMGVRGRRQARLARVAARRTPVPDRDALLRSFRDLAAAAWGPDVPPRTEWGVARSRHPALAVVVAQLTDLIGYRHRQPNGVVRMRIRDGTYAYYLTPQTIVRTPLRAPSGRETPPSREGPDDRHATDDRDPAAPAAPAVADEAR